MNEIVRPLPERGVDDVREPSYSWSKGELSKQFPLAVYRAEPTLLTEFLESRLPVNVHDAVLVSLLTRVRALEAEVAVLRSNATPQYTRSVVARQVDRDQARDEVRRFFSANDEVVVYPDEVAETLNLDVLMVIDLCAELAKEGMIAEAVSEGDEASNGI